MRTPAFLLACSILILASACGGDEPARQGSWLEPAGSSTTTMPPPAAGAETAAGTTMVVTLNDGRVATPETGIPIGPAVLTVMNAGQQVHGLHVEGPGVQTATENTLGAGESGTVNVTFQQGTYELYCPVLDHRGAGETTTVTIPTP